MNHIIQKEKNKKKEEDKKIFALFIDLKATFDKVDKGKLWDIMERKRITKKIIQRVKNI